MEDRRTRLLGVTPEMGEGFQRLQEVFDKEVFEFYMSQGKGYVPYMMNDALECYLVLDECRCTGACQPAYSGPVFGYLSEEEGEHILVVHQGEENIFTLWFREIQVRLEGYQYHQIGHFWLEGKGQEQWRQLVYMLGTVYDKYEYFGEAMCTPGEQELMLLMEFRPFRCWSPVKESLDLYYPDTARGAAQMKKIARRAGDRGMAFLSGIYEKAPLIFLENCMIRRMERPCSQKLYETIWEQVGQESGYYRERDYGEAMNRRIQEERAGVEERLHHLGFQGNYPRFSREDMEILAAEEHPFAAGLMEWEKFDFRIRLMVSEEPAGKRRGPGLNGGFFRGRGRKGQIRDLDWLKELT